MSHLIISEVYEIEHMKSTESRDPIK